MVLEQTKTRVAYAGLRDWMEGIDRLGELRVVEGANWEEDIGMATEVLQHAINRAPAVSFDAIPGFAPGYRVLVNHFGSQRRIAYTLGLDPDAPMQEIIQQWRKRNEEHEPLAPRIVSDGPVMENVHTGDDVNVLAFPTPRWHEADGGRYIGTGSMDITRDPDTGTINVGTYRVMVHNEKQVGFYISPGKHGRMHREKWFARNEPCPVAVVVGEDPLLFLASCTEVPLGMSEYAWTGGMRGEPTDVIIGPVTGLPIPAHAEIVLEGFASPNTRLLEGPFGEWTGYYASASREEPVLDVKAIYHRNNPIICGSPPNRPPDEQSYYRAFMRSAHLRADMEKAGVPDITGVWCHVVGGSRLLLAVSIKQRYPGHARQAGHVAAMCHAGAYLGRYVVVVDEDIDVTDLEDVMWAVCTRSDPAESIDIIQRAWSGPLDPRIHPDKKGFNSRAIIDATRPWEWRERFPQVNAPSPEVRQRALEKWGYLVNK